MVSQEDVASLVPEVYARYRRLVADGVRFFVEHLSAGRLAGVMADQIELPSDADPAHRLVRLLHHSPALHKLGQVVARRRELDAGLRRRLQQLETMAPRTPIERISPVIRRELGSAIEDHAMRIGPQALAEASVAVVVPFTWRERGRRRAGVLKVLKPGVIEQLTEDLEILGKLADYIDRRQEEYGLPSIEYRETFDEATAILLHEIRLEREQENLAAARRVYEGRPDVLVPEPLRFCTPRLTAMQRVFGRKVVQMEGSERACRQMLAQTVVRRLIGDVVMSRESRAMFHADPHAGNLMASEDGRLGILDWALVGRLGQRARDALFQIVAGGLSGDGRRLSEAIRGMATSEPEGQRLGPLVARALGEARRGWPGVEWAMRLLDSAARMGVRFGPDLLYFRKAYFTLEGVVADLCPSAPIGSLLTRAMLERLLTEWPGRWLAPIASREFGLRWSNGELVEMAAVLPIRLVEWSMAAGRGG